jgi:uncharacterized phiE125 gp8 family phage protein
MFPDTTPVLIDGPDNEPVSLTEAKSHLRVDADTEDDLISGLIAAAREWFEIALDRSLAQATWELRLPYCWQWQSRLASHVSHYLSRGYVLELPYPPLQSVESIKYLDLDGVQQTFSEDAYEVVTSATPGYVVLVAGQSWPLTAVDPEAMVVQFIAGQAADDVSKLIKAGIKLLVGHWYAHRESVGASMSEIPQTVQTIVQSCRSYRF